MLPFSGGSRVTVAERSPCPDGMTADFVQIVTVREEEGSGREKGEGRARKIRRTHRGPGLGRLDHLIDGAGERHRSVRRDVQRAAARPGLPAVETEAAGSQIAAAKPALVHAEGGVDEQIGSGRSRRPARKGDDPRLVVDEERIAPLVSIRRDANGEIVAADQSRFRPPDEAALVELGEHIGGVALVENEAQIPGSPLGRLQSDEQCRVQLRREAVQAVRGSANSQLLEIVEAFDVVIEILPLRAVEGDDPVLGLHIGLPTGARREEPPHAEIEQGHFVVVAGERGVPP